MEEGNLVTYSRQYFFRSFIVIVILALLAGAYILGSASWNYRPMEAEGIISGSVLFAFASFLGYRFTRITNRRIYKDHVEIYNMSGRCVLNIAYKDIDGWFYKQSRKKGGGISNDSTILIANGKKYNFSKSSLGFSDIDVFLKTFKEEDITLKYAYRKARTRHAYYIAALALLPSALLVNFLNKYNPAIPADELQKHTICGTVTEHASLTISGKNHDIKHIYFYLNEFPGKRFDIHNSPLIQEIADSVQKSDSVWIEITEADYNIYFTKLKPPTYWERVFGLDNIEPVSFTDSRKNYYSYTLESVSENRHSLIYLYFILGLFWIGLFIYWADLIGPGVEK